MKIEVRLATTGDAKGLSVLNQEFNGGDRRPVSVVSQSLASSNELVVVAVMEARPVGFACAQSFSSFCYQELQGEITEVYVREEARRQGGASAMIALLEERLFERGVREIKVLTGATNHGAIKAYELSKYERQDELVFFKE